MRSAHAFSAGLVVRIWTRTVRLRAMSAVSGRTLQQAALSALTVQRGSSIMTVPQVAPVLHVLPAQCGPLQPPAFGASLGKLITIATARPRAPTAPLARLLLWDR
jgi:hypothetical protein